MVSNSEKKSSELNVCVAESQHLLRWVASFMYNDVAIRDCREGFQRLKMEKNEDGTKVDSSAHAGNKVLPVSDQSTPSLMNRKKERTKNGETKKTKALSRMKELLKWAASPKSDKPSKFSKVLYFGNRTTLRVMGNDDNVRIAGAGDNGDDDESPKISLRWDTESCCTTSSTISALSEPCFSCKKHSNSSNFPRRFSTSRKGKWITTDSDFVVLELRRD